SAAFQQKYVVNRRYWNPRVTIIRWWRFSNQLPEISKSPSEALILNLKSLFIAVVCGSKIETYFNYFLRPLFLSGKFTLRRRHNEEMMKETLD
ncbi:hypothetical protein OAJ79_04745, partial [Verrucomicrobia bacterium]|nr:hypothetical protein [Verrucomicrobiota bacterium]